MLELVLVVTVRVVLLVFVAAPQQLVIDQLVVRVVRIRV